MAISVPLNQLTPLSSQTLSANSVPTMDMDIGQAPFEPADTDFYKIGYVQNVSVYGVEFKEGPDGFGVFASEDVEPRSRARKLPWMFFPDIVPIGHPIFDIINSTDPETDWDLRLACLLLYAFDRTITFGNYMVISYPAQMSALACFSQQSKIIKFLHPHPICLCVLSEDLMELQDQNLASIMRKQQQRALEFWQKNWHSGVPLKIKSLARDPERFIWAMNIAQSRCINMQVRIGTLVQDSNMLIPYADMLNHSFQPNREEMTVNYMNGQMNNMLMQGYGFSSPVNPWYVIQFSGNSSIHLNSFFSVFNYRRILCKNPGGHLKLRSMINLLKIRTDWYRLHRKLFVEKVIKALDIYQHRIPF
ncbi:plastid transcriptionally active 14 [Melia azedarach]|uniref:Plastid transcriptionally active 14 n=1 Tax=Melia azedarach TaxID=155640 RepID=A0ACC1WU56_MELAZ|nr:plastid transcriptionally active 14 [Melia azedarach]